MPSPHAVYCIEPRHQCKLAACHTQTFCSVNLSPTLPEESESLSQRYIQRIRGGNTVLRQRIRIRHKHIRVTEPKCFADRRLERGSLPFACRMLGAEEPMAIQPHVRSCVLVGV